MKIPVLVDSRIRIPIALLPGVVSDSIRVGFCHTNPNYPDPRDASEPQYYRTWRHEGEYLTLPRGGMQRVRAALSAAGLSWEVADERTWEHPEPGFPDHLLTERPYQTRMREAAERKQNCLLHGATGAGKTAVLYSLLSRLKRRSLVMVWTGGLLDQWRERAQREFDLTEREVGIIQGTREWIRPLTICMQQTIAARFEHGDDSLVDQFDVLACDEVQRMAARTCQAAVDPFRARYRIGVSADSSRHDRLECLIHDLFGDVAEEITEEETIAAGATVDVEVYAVPTNFRAPWYRYRQDFNKLLAQMTADEERNELALRIARQEVEQGEQVLLFTHRVEHALALDSRLTEFGIRSGCMLGGADNREAFRLAADGFRAGMHRAGVGTYQAIAQGIDLPTVSRGVCTTPMHNNRQQLSQVKGRICRGADGKEIGRLYVLVDQHVYGRKPVQNFVKWFRTVRVFDGESWIDGKEWLRMQRAA